jgi:Ribbon-helix-helix protein, copG family
MSFRTSIFGGWYSTKQRTNFALKAQPRAEQRACLPNLTYVSHKGKLTYMEKTQIYLPKDELAALRRAAKQAGRSVADMVREAIRKTVLKPSVSGPVAIWDGQPKNMSMEHDSVHDEV